VKPVGILRGSDLMNAKLAAMCMASGLSIPNEIALLGYGNRHQICESAPITLSSLDPGDYEQGKMAVDALAQHLSGEGKANSTHLVPCKGVIERQSTQFVSTDDKTVAKAVEYIWKNFEKPITVDMVSEHLAVSRRKLERDFKKHLGCGISEEVRRKRLSSACELLRTSCMTIDEIAIKTGIGETVSLHRAFQKKYGMTPGEYRLLSTR